MIATSDAGVGSWSKKQLAMSGVIKCGSVIGERSFVSGKPRAATVREKSVGNIDDSY